MMLRTAMFDDDDDYEIEAEDARSDLELHFIRQDLIQELSPILGKDHPVLEGLIQGGKMSQGT